MNNVSWNLGGHVRTVYQFKLFFFNLIQVIGNDCLKCCVEKDWEERVLGLISNVCHVLQMDDGGCNGLTYCLKLFTSLPIAM